MFWLNLWLLPPAYFFAGGPWVAASTRHSLRPLFSREARMMQNSGAIAPRGSWSMFWKIPATLSAVMLRESGASSIPETAVLERMDRGVLDRSVETGR